MLKIKNLFSGYEGLEVLKGIDLEVGDKKIVSVIGPNGAGKSTVIKSVFNIANTTDGEILFEGENLIGMKTYDLIKLGISYVPQGRVIFGDLTVKENLEIGEELIDNESELEKRLNEIYEMFPILQERENELAYGLSGGERQMLALARALLTKPKLLMLDEPSLGLSPKLQKELFETIKKLRKNFGISILIVEQNAKKAIKISDKTYLLEDGKVALSGGKEILRKKKIKQVYLGGRY
jgi:branched-chain amino acid transport system ATP-binding protein